LAVIQSIRSTAVLKKIKAAVSKLIGYLVSESNSPLFKKEIEMVIKICFTAPEAGRNVCSVQVQK